MLMMISNPIEGKTKTTTKTYKMKDVFTNAPSQKKNKVINKVKKPISHSFGDQQGNQRLHHGLSENKL